MTGYTVDPAETEGSRIRRPDSRARGRLRAELLRELSAGAPFEPATSLFRTFELEHLLVSGALRPGGRALDVGCGSGRIAAILKGRAGPQWELIGVDPDPEETALAAASGIYARVHVGGAAVIPEPDASFDIAFSNSVLEHVEDVDAVLRELHRVLRPGGRIVITVPSEHFHDMLSGPGLLGWVATGTRRVAPYRTALDRRLRHLRYWSSAEWAAALTRAGLRLEATSFYLTRKELARWETLSNLTGGLAARLFGPHRQPIEVQRSLGLRRAAPGWLIQRLSLLAARIASIGLSSPDAGGRCDAGAGLLVRARRDRHHAVSSASAPAGPRERELRA